MCGPGRPIHHFLAGVPITLQYLLFGVYRVVLGIRWVFKWIGGELWQITHSREVEHTRREKYYDSMKLIIEDEVVGNKEKINKKQA